MPVCSRCGKESKNLRVCPFCHSEYTADDLAGRTPAPGRASRATPTPLRGTKAIPAPGAPGRPGTKKAALSPVTKFGLPVVIVGFAVWYFMFTGERRIPVGVVAPEIITLPMTRIEAEGLLDRVKNSGQIDTKEGALSVTFAAAMWPQRRDGQLALAQQYARADSIVNNARRHSISFFDPQGGLYAKSDPTGVTMVK